MTTDTTCLLILALWSIPLNHLPTLARVTQAGVAWGLGNREQKPEVAAWVERADRAQRNHHDRLANGDLVPPASLGDIGLDPLHLRNAIAVKIGQVIGPQPLQNDLIVSAGVDETGHVNL